MNCTCQETGQCPVCEAATVPARVVRTMVRNGELAAFRQRAAERKRSASSDVERGELALIVSREVFGGRPGRENTRRLLQLAEAEVGEGKLSEDVPLQHLPRLEAAASEALDEIAENQVGIEAAHTGVKEHRESLLDPERRLSEAAARRRRDSASIVTRTRRLLEGLRAITAEEWGVLGEELSRSRSPLEVVPSGELSARSRIDRRKQVLDEAPGAVAAIGRLLDILDPSAIESVQVRHAVCTSLAKWLEHLPPVPGEGAATPETGASEMEAA